MTQRRIALLVDRLVGFNHNVLRGVRDHAKSHPDWVCRFFDPRPEFLPNVAAWRPDGVIAFVGTPEQSAAIQTLNVPLVDVGGWVEHPRLNTVGLDDFAIGQLAATTLLDLGYEQFAFVGNRTVNFGRLRGAGFAHVLGQLGYRVARFEALSSQMPGAVPRWSVGGRDSELEAWLEALPKPVAVFAENDERAVYISESCTASGISIPHDVALLGVDDDPYLCELGMTTLSSISTPAREVGRRSAEALAAMFQGHSPKPVRLQPSGVVHRHSTSEVAFSDDLVRQVLLHCESCERISDFARDAGVSRRTLERHFRAVTGRPPLQMIQEQRLRRARLQVLTTDTPLTEIARECGFRSVSRFSNSFKQQFGSPPGSLRRSKSASI